MDRTRTARTVARTIDAQIVRLTTDSTSHDNATTTTPSSNWSDIVSNAESAQHNSTHDV